MGEPNIGIHTCIIGQIRHEISINSCLNAIGNFYIGFIFEFNVYIFISNLGLGLAIKIDRR